MVFSNFPTFSKRLVPGETGLFFCKKRRVEALQHARERLSYLRQIGTRIMLMLPSPMLATGRIS